jgi:hypothetical protein
MRADMHTSAGCVVLALLARYCEHQIKYKGGAAPSAQQLKQLADEVRSTPLADTGAT